ncbi:hypothetical protein L3V83_00640 [Thiotrichales bacterium 19X7-9]|nr:hypothetical protein [Thiotrichales bacterium 19X7-9]
MIRLETNKRYYLINLTKDLLDQCCVVCTWVLNFQKLAINKLTLLRMKYQVKALLQKSLKHAKVMAINVLKINILIR